MSTLAFPIFLLLPPFWIIISVSEKEGDESRECFVC